MDQEDQGNNAKEQNDDSKRNMIHAKTMNLDIKSGKKLLTKSFTNTDNQKMALNPDLYPQQVEQENIISEMFPAYNQQYKIYDWFNMYNERMKEIFRKRQMLLEEKYDICKKWLDKAEEQIILAKDTRERLMNEYHSSPEFLRTLKECQIFTEQQQSLHKKEQYLKGLCLQLRERILQFQKELAQKKYYVCRLNQKNVEISMEITKQRRKLKILQMMKQRKEEKEQQDSEDLLSASKTNKTSKDEIIRDMDEVRYIYNKYKKQLYVIKTNNNKLYTTINKKSGQYLKLCDFFTVCLKFYEKFLYKSQQIAQDEGLNGSLFFELVKKKKNADAMAVNKRFHFKTQSSQREVLNLVYDTMRHLVYKKDERQKQAEEDLTLPKDMLENFTSVQIRENQILNIWEKKKRSMNIVTQKLKVIRR